MTRYELADRQCVPCRKGTPPLRGGDLAELYHGLEAGWRVVDEHHLEKTYKLADFREALAFTNAVGEIAEQEGHHPEITLTWGRVSLRVWTHKIDGLTESDFVLAAKADRAFGKRGGQDDEN